MGIFDKFKSIFKTEKLNVPERFELLREAISGTMSKFYMARDRNTKQVVGLKIGDREKVTTFEGRFKGLNKPSEGEIAVQMKHERIVQTYEFGETIEDLNYLVMEFIEGQGVHSLINKKDETVAEHRLELIRQMGAAIREVHKSGFIHRDICPRNFICNPAALSVKLIDFGLSVPATKEFMQPGNRTGTPIYMSPEVVRRRWTDHRLDLFSFGVTAYQLCTFDLPWEAVDATGKAALAHDTEEPRDIRELAPNLNPTLADAIMKCMEVDADRRPNSMDEFLISIRKLKSAYK